MSDPIRSPSGRLRSGALGALAALTALACLACERPVPRAAAVERLRALGRPDVVLIVVDTLRADRTSPYGFRADVTPELARWAQRGVVFEHVLSQSSWTKISMASMLTSLWPHTHGVSKFNDGLGEGALTLAEVFRQAGYHTYGVQTNGWLHSSFGFEQGFEHYIFPSGRLGGAPSLPEASLWPHADRVFEETVRILDIHPAGEPLFLYLHLMDVHEYGAPAEFRVFGADDQGHYVASVRWIDDLLERVRKELDARGLLERAILVLASDHGEAFGENGNIGHARNVFTPVLHVPLVIRMPFPLQPIRVPQQVRNLDLAPTLLELAGIPVPSSFEGQSLVPLLLGSAQDAGDRVSRASLGPPVYPNSLVQESVTDGQWTYARNVELDPESREYLFDRRVDPGEDVNLIQREPAVAARMRALFDAGPRGTPGAGVRRPEVRIEPSIAERLRQMGYVEQGPAAPPSPAAP